MLQKLSFCRTKIFRKKKIEETSFSNCHGNIIKAITTSIRNVSSKNTRSSTDGTIYNNYVFAITFFFTKGNPAYCIGHAASSNTERKRDWTWGVCKVKFTQMNHSVRQWEQSTPGLKGRQGLSARRRIRLRHSMCFLGLLFIFTQGGVGGVLGGGYVAECALALSRAPGNISIVPGSHFP